MQVLASERDLIASNHHPSLLITWKKTQIQSPLWGIKHISFSLERESVCVCVCVCVCVWFGVLFPFTHNGNHSIKIYVSSENTLPSDKNQKQNKT